MTSEAPLRIALVGFGYWGPNIARNIDGLPQAELAAVCDMSPNRLMSASSSYPATRTARTISELDSSLFDAVVIATPTRSHYSLAKHFLGLGKHVLVEKPLTADSCEARELVELADANKLTLMVDHTFVYTDAVRMMKKLVDEGLMGDLVYFDSSRVNLGLFQPDVSVMWDLAVHDLAILDYLIGKRVAAVSATGGIHRASEHPAVAALSLEFETGFFAHLMVSWLSPVKLRRMILGGTQSTVVFDDLSSDEKIKIYDSGIDISSAEDARSALLNYRLGDVLVPRLANTEALRREIGHFIECVRHRTEPETSGRRAVGIVETLEAAHRSIAMKGAPVRL
jgi:predicted dehydrogenase